MIIESIRYFIDEENREPVIAARRDVMRIRMQVGLPAGRLLVADPPAEGAPSLVWQCGYSDEGDLGMADARLIGNTEYEAARERLASLVTRVELEIYTTDDEES